MADLRAIIADDEDSIIDLIKRLGNWEKHGIQVVAQANDGLTAYEQIVEYEPDIAVLDIRMPELSGLQLIRRCVNEERPIRFLLISGYREFEYVKEAISYNVSDYMVKPINEKVLNRSLNKISKAILRERESVMLVDRLSFQINQKDTKLWHVFFSHIRSNSLPELAKINGEYGFSLRSGCFGILIAKIDRMFIEYEKYVPMLAENLQGIINEQLEPLCISLGCYVDGQRLYYLLNYAPDAGKLEETIEYTLELCIREAKNYGQCYVTFGRNMIDRTYAELPAMLIEAEAAVDYRWVLRPGKLIRYNKAIADYRLKNGEISLSQEQLEKLYGILEGQNLDALDSFLQNIKANYSISNSFSDSYRLILCNVVEHILRFIGNVPADDEAWMVLDLDNWQEDWRQFVIRIEQVLIRIVGVRMENKALLSDRHIRAAKRYIEQNYTSQIQLEDVADAVSLAATYLGMLFKEKTGVNFSEYLQRTRINAAKELFSTTGHTIKDVCAMVGYHDVKYFSRLFKQYVSITPSLYQKIHSIY